jgi:PAS domain S-box-containing protein
VFGEDQMINERSEFGRSAQLLEEAEETLRAIQHGTVDAFVVEEPEGHRVYTLEGSDLPYSTLVERMQQGAAMLDRAGCIVYCNLSLARFLGMPRETVIGHHLKDFLAPEDQACYQKLLQENQLGSSEGEMHLRLADGNLIAANFSFSILSREQSATGVLITDLTSQKQQAELSSRLLQMQDEERRRIARELHDSVGQFLAAISMNIAVVSAEAHKLSPATANRVAENAVLVDQVSKEIRTMSYLLHPPLLDVAGLASALRWYVDGFSERSKIKVNLDIPEDLGRLPDGVEVAVFRIIQECLTNIHRHSGSATASIRIHQDGKELVLEVQDRGKGMSEEKQRELTMAGRAGVGMGGIRERLRQFGGTFTIQSDGTGTLIKAILPVEKQVV